MYADKIVQMGEPNFHPSYMKIMEPVAHIRNYRGLPEPYREISLDEFLQLSVTWCPTHYDFLQVILPGEKFVRNGWSMWNHLYGYAVLKGQAEFGVDKFGRQVYLESKNARYFRLGCEHTKSVEQPSKGNCLHDFICQECGTHWGYDSGD